MIITSVGCDIFFVALDSYQVNYVKGVFFGMLVFLFFEKMITFKCVRRDVGFVG